MKRQLSLSFATAILFTCCIGCFKKPVPPPVPIPDWEYPAYQYYVVNYNKTQHTTSVWTELRLNNETGRSVKVADDSTVLVNRLKNDLFSFKKLTGLEDVFFAFRRKNQSFYNRASRSDISDINFSVNTPAEIHLNGSTSFTWDGPQLEANEEADITFETLHPINLNQTVSSTIGLSGSTIMLGPPTLSSLSAGNYKMILTRIRKLPLTETDSTAGGLMTIKLTVERNVLLK